MRTFKRDNWTREQVCHFMQGLKIACSNGSENNFCKRYNMIVDDIVSFMPREANVTNDQILKFLDSIKMTRGDAEFMAKYNGVVDDIKCFFYDFAMPVEEFGAMGYCEEEDIVYHIGAIPEEFTNQ